MAVDNAPISYAQNFALEGENGTYDNGIIQYRDTLYGNLYLTFPTEAPTKIQGLSNSDYPTSYAEAQFTRKQLLYEYANGMKIYATDYVQYHEGTSTTTGYYEYFWRFDLVSSENSLIEYNVESFRWDDVQFPLREVDRPLWNQTFNFYCSFTDYGVAPIVGDSPEYITPFGVVTVSPVDNPRSVAGESISRDDYRTQYKYIDNRMHQMDSSDDYDDFVDFMDNYGDGTKVIPDGKDPTKPNNQNNDPSGPGGGNGNYNPSDKGDKIPVASLPSNSAVGTGMVNLYNPTLQQIRSLANFLWSDNFIDNVKKLKNDPFENIISLSMIPFTPSDAGSELCKIGNITTDVTMKLCGQYQSISCGFLTVDEQWAGFLDYSPYTHIELYLPFIGIVSIKTDDVMGKTIKVDYNIDCLTGSSVCFVSAGDRVLYTYNCNTVFHIPLTGSNSSEFISAIINVGSKTLGGAIAGAGVGSIAGGVGALPGAIIGGIGGGLSGVAQGSTAKEHSVQRGSSLTGESGILGEFKPYIIIHRPVQSLPSNFKHFKGFRSNISGSLGSFSGYTEVEYAHLDGVSATDTEKDEIMQLLSKGVIV